MKVTSFEISKKLAEIGFNKKHNYHYRFGCDTGWKIEIGRASKKRGDIPAYDFEKIYDTLPSTIFYKSGIRLFTLSKLGLMGYDAPLHSEFRLCMKKNSSLANVAARLLIKLYEAGLVKFKEE